MVRDTMPTSVRPMTSPAASPSTPPTMRQARGLEQDDAQQLPARGAQRPQDAEAAAALHDRETHGAVDQEQAHQQRQQAQRPQVGVERLGHVQTRAGALRPPRSASLRAAARGAAAAAPRRRQAPAGTRRSMRVSRPGSPSHCCAVLTSVSITAASRRRLPSSVASRLTLQRMAAGIELRSCAGLQMQLPRRCAPAPPPRAGQPLRQRRRRQSTGPRRPAARRPRRTRSAAAASGSTPSSCSA